MGENRNLGAIFVVSGILIVVAVTFAFSVLPGLIKPPTNLWLGDGIFKTRLALNQADRETGLSGMDYLNQDEALLMVFPKEDFHAIWMKDMNIPIDIIWINKDKKVVYIVKNVSPDLGTSQSFKPKKPAKYVVEVAAGTVDRKAIRPNLMAIFDIDEKTVK